MPMAVTRKRQAEQKRFDERKFGRNKKTKHPINALIAGPRRIRWLESDPRAKFTAGDSHHLPIDFSFKVFTLEARRINPDNIFVCRFEREHIHKARLDEINTVFANLKAGHVDGRIVIDLA